MRYQRGFTLIEVLVTIVIIGILVTILITGFSMFNKTQALERDSELVIETLAQARSQTLSSHNANQYGVHVGTSEITLFTGGAYSSSDGNNIVFPLFSSDTIFTITLNGGGSDIVFQRLTGETSQFGSIVISSPTSSRTKTVTIHKTGIIESN